MIKTNSEMPIHYRYTDGVTEDGFHIYEHKFYPVRETPYFYWCLTDWEYNLHVNGQDRSKSAKRISKDGVRRKAYPCKKQALRSYKKRKESQLLHARNAIDISSYALEMLSDTDEIKTVEDYGMQRAFLGNPEFMSRYIFD